MLSNPSASFRRTLLFSTCNDYDQESKEIFIPALAALTKCSSIDERNYILNLFLHIYYHDFILADDCIALKVIYFGGINKKCRLMWWISFQHWNSEILQPSSKHTFCSYHGKHKWIENIIDLWNLNVSEGNIQASILICITSFNYTYKFTFKLLPVKNKILLPST